MKMSKVLYLKLKDRVRDVLARKEVSPHEMWEAHTNMGMTHERMRWDVMWASRWYEENNRAINTEGLKDAHIDTALCRVWRELGAPDPREYEANY